MTEELTLEILAEAFKKLPPITYPKQIRVSFGDYQRMRVACDLLKIIPEQVGGFTLGFFGERILPDIDIADAHYEVDW